MNANKKSTQCDDFYAHDHHQQSYKATLPYLLGQHHQNFPPHSPQYEDPHHSPQEDSPANNYLQETVVSNAVTHHSVPNLSPTLSAEAKVALVEHFANSDRIRVAGNGQCLISAINTSRARLLLPILDPDHTRQLICDFYRFNAIGQAHIQRSDLNISTVTKAILEEWLDDTALYALTHLLNCSFTVYHILHQNTVCDGISISEISSTIPHPAPTSAPPHRINLLLKNSNHYDGLLDREDLPSLTHPSTALSQALPASIAHHTYQSTTPTSPSPDSHHSLQEDSPANNYLQETVVSNAVTHHSVPNLSPTLSAEAKVALVEHFANSDRIRVAGNGQCLISAINTSRARLLLPILDPDHTRQLICDFYRFNAIGQAHIQRSDLNISTVTKAILEEWLDDTALYALTHLLNCSFTVYHILHQNTVCDGISISEISSTIPHPAPTSAPPHRINLLLKNSNHYDGLLDRGELLTPTSTISTSQLTKTSHQTCPLPTPKKLKLTDYFSPTEKPHHDLFCSKPKTSQAKSASRNKSAPPRKHHSQSQSIKRQIAHEDTHLVHPPNERPTCVSKLARSSHHIQPLHPHNQPDPTELPISEQCPASPISRTLYRPQGTPHEHPSRKRARDVSPHKPGGIT